MANKLFTSDQQNKALRLIGLFFLLFLMQQGNAREFTVGGSNWSVRNGTNTETYNHWAERNRFQINDSLVFIYPPNEDSVLVVTLDAYTNCNTDSPLEKFTDGHTVYTFDHSGPFYFISGSKDNCLKNESLIVVVMADRSNRSTSPATNSTTTASPPSPPPSSETAPTPAPSPPSPAPSGSGKGTPSPAPSCESPPVMSSVPAPGPSAEQSPHKNAASSVFVSIGGFLGAAVASSLVLA